MKNRRMMNRKSLRLLVISLSALTLAVSPVWAGETDTASLDETSHSAGAAVDQTETGAASDMDQVEAARAMDTSKVADASDLAAPAQEGTEAETEHETSGLSLKDGTYEISVDSSSSMFNIDACSLTVKDGSMTADMTLSGTGYLFLYPGTAEEAAKADADSFIYYTVGEDGKFTYVGFPVGSLDSPVDCAAFSKKKEQWYPRTLTFKSSSLPGDAFAQGAGTDASSIGLEDGGYLADVTLEGEADVTAKSPADLTVKDNNATVRLVLSSDKYDYAKVDGIQYDAETTDEGLCVEIPVQTFDRAFPVILDSTAIAGMQVEQDFTLTVASEGLTRK